jgi:hypothetical protein
MKLNNLCKGLTPLRQVALGALAAFSLGNTALQAADHGDAPVPSNNQEVDIADVFVFMDPSPGNGDNVILIATIRGFIAAGENSNFGIFDPNVRYRIEVEDTGDTKADKLIDVSFSPRTANPGPATREILQVPTAQTATIKFTNFKDASNKKIKTIEDLPTTGSSTAGTAPTPVINENIGGTGIKFCAGMFDDPFFFDIPAFGAFIKSIRDNGPQGADPTVFTRARDSFAGYNVMAIAFSIPKSLLLGSDGSKLGVAFYAQKNIVQNPSKKTGDIKGTGTFRTLDRMANPAVNVALIPFNRKNEYNQGTPKDDANGRFAEDILATLTALGTNATNQGILAGVAVTNGDYLRLDTSIANTGLGGGDNAPASFPNGRRLKDDTVDILLSIITNGALTTGDGVGTGVTLDNPLKDVFPFLAAPNQPFPNGVTDDRTRN